MRSHVWFFGCLGFLLGFAGPPLRQVEAFRFLSTTKDAQKPTLLAIQAFLHQKDTESILHLQAVLSASGLQRISWLLAFPHDATFREATSEVVDQISDFSTPFIELHASRTNQSSGCGVQPPPPKTDDSKSILRLLASPQITGLRLTLLDQASAADLQAALEALGFFVDPAWLPALQEKITSKQRFLLLEIPDTTAQGPRFKIAPLEIRLPRRSWPTLSLSDLRDRASSPLPFLFFVLASDRVDLSAYKSRLVDDLAIEIRRLFLSEGTLIYEEAFASLDPKGETFFTEFARDLRKICPLTIRSEDPAAAFCEKYALVLQRIRDSDSFLTRLHGRLHPDTLQDSSLRIVPRTEVSGQMIVEDRRPSDRALASPLFLPLLLTFLGTFAFRRSSAKPL